MLRRGCSDAPQTRPTLVGHHVGHARVPGSSFVQSEWSKLAISPLRQHLSNMLVRHETRAHAGLSRMSQWPEPLWARPSSPLQRSSQRRARWVGMAERHPDRQHLTKMVGRGGRHAILCGHQWCCVARVQLPGQRLRRCAALKRRRHKTVAEPVCNDMSNVSCHGSAHISPSLLLVPHPGRRTNGRINALVIHRA